jgi:hypothetical protein
MFGDPWVGRSPFDRMMDEIAAAESVREVEHLRSQARRDLGGDPRLGELERLADAVTAHLVRPRTDAPPPTPG